MFAASPRLSPQHCIEGAGVMADIQYIKDIQPVLSYDIILPGQGLPLAQQFRLWQQSPLRVSQRGRTPADFLSRFWSKVCLPAYDIQLCWQWTAAIGPDGYGFMKCRGKRPRAHQIAWHLYHGPVPEGLCIDHLCRNRLCVNPLHMEVVTPVENIMRGESLPAQYSRRNYCSKGHLYTQENTGVGRKIRQKKVTLYRACRFCARVKSARYRKAKNDPSSAPLQTPDF
jgi:hypothetical protein